MNAEEVELLGDSKYRNYVAAVDKALKNFEYSSEWADLISALGKLNKVTVSDGPKLGVRCTTCREGRHTGTIHCRETREVTTLTFSFDLIAITPEMIAVPFLGYRIQEGNNKKSGLSGPHNSYSKIQVFYNNALTSSCWFLQVKGQTSFIRFTNKKKRITNSVSKNKR